MNDVTYLSELEEQLAAYDFIELGIESSNYSIFARPSTNILKENVSISKTLLESPIKNRIASYLGLFHVDYIVIASLSEINQQKIKDLVENVKNDLVSNIAHIVPKDIYLLIVLETVKKAFVVAAERAAQRYSTKTLNIHPTIIDMQLKEKFHCFSEVPRQKRADEWFSLTN